MRRRLGHLRVAPFCQPSECSCDEETGAGVCWCSLERLHICFIIINAAAPMTMPETRFNFAVKNISDSARFISVLFDRWILRWRRQVGATIRYNEFYEAIVG